LLGTLAEALAPSVAFAAWEFITGPLRDNPRRVGKPLLAPFQDDWSARRGHYGVRYRVDDDKGVITVIEIADRTDVYHPRAGLSCFPRVLSRRGGHGPGLLVDA
jgi:mRNA interferase RelE/StbE